MLLHTRLVMRGCTLYNEFAEATILVSFQAAVPLIALDEPHQPITTANNLLLEMTTSHQGDTRG